MLPFIMTLLIALGAISHGAPSASQTGIVHRALEPTPAPITSGHGCHQC